MSSRHPLLTSDSRSRGTTISSRTLAGLCICVGYTILGIDASLISHGLSAVVLMNGLESHGSKATLRIASLTTHPKDRKSSVATYEQIERKNRQTSNVCTCRVSPWELTKGRKSIVCKTFAPVPTNQCCIRCPWVQSPSVLDLA